YRSPWRASRRSQPRRHGGRSCSVLAFRSPWDSFSGSTQPGKPPRSTPSSRCGTSSRQVSEPDVQPHLERSGRAGLVRRLAEVVRGDGALERARVEAVEHVENLDEHLAETLLAVEVEGARDTQVDLGEARLLERVDLGEPLLPAQLVDRAQI